MRKRFIAIAGVLLAAVGPVVPAHAQTPSAEEELLALINTVRGGKTVVMHAGLRDVARKHSEAMATAGSLNHRGAKARIDAATPDRPQSGGAPDSGFTGTWCEVVGWEPGGADAGVARRFFADWRETAEDNKCMTNKDMNVAGLGVYERGNRWWATLEMAQDTTPPAAPKTTTTPVPPRRWCAPRRRPPRRTSPSRGRRPRRPRRSAGKRLACPSPGSPSCRSSTPFGAAALRGYKIARSLPRGGSL